MSSQNVQHYARRMNVVAEGFGTNSFHGVDPVGQDRAQDVDHLPVAARLAFQLALHPADRDRKSLP